MVDLGVVGVGTLEVIDLSAKVATLVLTGDSSIEEDLFRGECGAAVGGIAGVKELFDVSRVLEVLTTRGGDCTQLILGMPSGESLTSDAILAYDRRWGKVVNVPYCDERRER